MVNQSGDVEPQTWEEGEEELAVDDDAEVDGDVEGEAPLEPGAKRRKTSEQAELEAGTCVLYWGGWRGVIRDAFVPLDEYWVEDEETRQLIRDDTGEIAKFHAEELEVVAPPPPENKLVKAAAAGDGSTRGGILLLGVEGQMTRILEHFGAPDTSSRQNPQQLLAIPCNMCHPEKIQATASEGVDEQVLELAHQQRQDIHVAIRSFRLKQAMQQLVPNLLNMEAYYCLVAVQIPYSWEAIEASTNKRDRREREEIWNQIDLCVTATGEYREEKTPEAAASRSLGETCGIKLSEQLWAADTQTKLRRKLGCDIPLRFQDPSDTRILVIILPEDAKIEDMKGVLYFDEATEAPQSTAAEAKAASAKAADARKVQGKTVAEWEKEQEELAGGGPKLPPGWIRVRSSSGKIYFFNQNTRQATFDMPELPLPPGWTKQVSKSTGKTYYFNSARAESTFERPTR